jgi:hypothetical protein
LSYLTVAFTGVITVTVGINWFADGFRHQEANNTKNLGNAQQGGWAGMEGQHDADTTSELAHCHNAIALYE